MEQNHVFFLKKTSPKIADSQKTSYICTVFFGTHKHFVAQFPLELAPRKRNKSKSYIQGARVYRVDFFHRMYEAVLGLRGIWWVSTLFICSYKKAKKELSNLVKKIVRTEEPTG